MLMLMFMNSLRFSSRMLLTIKITCKSKHALQERLCVLIADDSAKECC